MSLKDVYTDRHIEITPEIVKAECERIQGYTLRIREDKDLNKYDQESWEAITSLMETAVFLINEMEPDLHEIETKIYEEE